MLSDIMTLPEVAEYLKVDKKTVYRMVKAGQIPAFRVRSEWRFRKEAIDVWIEQGAPAGMNPEPLQAKPAETETDWFDIPVLGRIAAGTPILAEENIEGTVKVAKKRLRNPDGVFALRVRGDSMINAQINNGDTVIIRQQPTVENGQIAAVVIEDEATLKRVYFETGRIRLQPENDSMKPMMVYPANKNVRIAGKMLMVMRQEHKRERSDRELEETAKRTQPERSEQDRPEPTAANLTRDKIFRQLKKHRDILEKYNVRRIGLFGSYARGDQTPASDIDFIADFDLTRFGENFKGLYRAFIDLSDYLEGLFKKKVEIFSPDDIKNIRIKEVRDNIERSIIYA
ncbi:MAG: transcriptional repressor LexA [Planctomycetota bacterium]